MKKRNILLSTLLPTLSVLPAISAVSCSSEDLGNITVLDEQSDKTLESISTKYFEDINKNPNILKRDYGEFVSAIFDGYFDERTAKNVNYGVEINEVDGTRLSLTLSVSIEKFSGDTEKWEWIIKKTKFEIFEVFDTEQGNFRFYLAPIADYNDHEWYITRKWKIHKKNGNEYLDEESWGWHTIPTEFISVRDNLYYYLAIESWYLNKNIPTPTTRWVDWHVSSYNGSSDHAHLVNQEWPSYNLKSIKAGTLLSDLKAINSTDPFDIWPYDIFIRIDEGYEIDEDNFFINVDNVEPKKGSEYTFEAMSKIDFWTIDIYVSVKPIES